MLYLFSSLGSIFYQLPSSEFLKKLKMDFWHSAEHDLASEPELRILEIIPDVTIQYY